MATSLSRRQFLKLTTGALTGAAAVQMAGCGLVGPSSDRSPKGARVQAGREVASVCPYCAVGCGQIVTVANNQILDIQGNPDSPINVGTLCPKGAATYQLAVNPNRWTKVKYRAPFSREWVEMPLDRAMDMVAERLKKTRDENFVETMPIGGKTKRVNHVQAIPSLGGATIDDEWNYIHQKLLRSIGLVSIENQARI